MISECRIYAPDGKLKEVVPAETLVDRFWDEALADLEPHKRASRNVARSKSRGRKASDDAITVLRRIVEWMGANTPPDGRAGWTASELMRAGGVEPDDSCYKQSSTILRNAHRPSYGGFPVVRKRVGGGGKRVRYEYFLEARK